MKGVGFVLGLGIVVADRGPSGSSVQKVINMLTDMSAECKKEKQQEEVAFAKFSVWCDGGADKLAKSVSDAAAAIESFDADRVGLETDIKELAGAIKQLNARVAKSEADKTNADAQRKKDHAAFQSESTDYAESVDALERALATLAQQHYDRPALLQLTSSDKIPARAKSFIATFLELKGSDNDDAPEANAYESHSGGIIDMLKKLRDQFREKLGTCNTEEMNSKAAYEMLVQDLTDTVANSKKDSSEKVQEKARKQEKLAFTKKEIEATSNSKAEDSHTLANLDVECKEKKLSYNEKQQLRTEEIEAIEKAIEIMSSPEAAGNSDEHFAFLQTTSVRTALPQLRSSGIRHRVYDFLRSESQRLHSQKIGLLAESIEADPFAKVKKMIDNMITRLLEEAKEDADHEGFCDTEIGQSKITRNKLSAEIDGLDASINEGKSTILELTEKVSTLTKEINELDQSLEQAASLRAEEKAKNKATIVDAKAGAAATQAATKVLKEFYAKAGVATGFVQESKWAADGVGVKMGSEEWNALGDPKLDGTVDKGHKAGMQTFGDSYKGSDKTGGVLALLEVILSDFFTLEADTTASEAQSQDAYEQFVVEAKKNQAAKTKQVDLDTADKVRAEASLQQDTSDLKSTQDQLLAAERYYAKLEPQCIDKGMTFDERKGARQSEIASLKEALKLLSGEDIA